MNKRTLFTCFEEWNVCNGSLYAAFCCLGLALRWNDYEVVLYLLIVRKYLEIYINSIVNILIVYGYWSVVFVRFYLWIGFYWVVKRGLNTFDTPKIRLKIKRITAARPRRSWIPIFKSGTPLRHDTSWFSIRKSVQAPAAPGLYINLTDDTDKTEHRYI